VLDRDAAHCPLMIFVPEGSEPPPHVIADGWQPPTKYHVALEEISGRLITPCAGAWDLTLADEHQERHKTPDGLVYIRDRRGTLLPQMVARPEVRPGHLVTLGDDQAWEIPAALLVTGETALPRRRVLGDDGRPVWQVEDAYKSLTAFAEKLWGASRGSLTMTDDEVDRACGQALSVNYRIGLTEALVLDLLTDASMSAICKALIDWPTVESIAAAEKKK